MDSSRIKTVVIILLVMVNAAFLSILGVNAATSYRLERQAVEDLKTVLLENGVLLGDGAIGSDVAPMPVTLDRDDSAEFLASQALLGQVEVSDQGGNIYIYEGAEGSARYRGNGEFEFSFSPGGYVVEDELTLSTGLAEKAGFEVDRDSASVTREAGRTVVSMYFVYDGSTVYNCTLSFDFEGGRLISAHGRRVTGRAAGQLEGEPMSAYTAAMRFLSLMRAEGIVCSEIYEITAGLSMSSSASAENSLSPVWFIATNAGDYCIDAISGEMISIS